MHDILVPAMGESITEGTISKWLVKVGDSVKQGDLLLELETDKVNLEISAEQDGVISEILANEGDTVKIGDPVGRIGAAGAAPAAAAPAAAPAQEQAAAPVAAPASVPAAVPSSNEGSSATLATPAARKLAREKGIDLNAVPARDPIGRIHASDVASAGTAPAAAPQAAPAAPAAIDKPTSNANKPEERKRMSRRRMTIAKRLVEAQHTAAMLTTFNEVDMSAIMEIRKRRKDSFKEKHEVGLGFMSFFTKAVVGALKAFPHLNAEISGDDIIVKKYYDIGIAVSAKEGLVVPVVRDADRLGFESVEDAGLADIVIISGSEAETIPLAAYRDRLEPAARRGVPCYCTNPDRHKLTKGGGTAPGAGSIALVYQELGGSVRWFGKPYPAIYHHAQSLLETVTIDRIVCVGDSLEHDIAGAAGVGLASCLVRTGIASELSDAALEAAAARLGVSPTFMMEAFLA